LNIFLVLSIFFLLPFFAMLLTGLCVATKMIARSLYNNFIPFFQNLLKLLREGNLINFFDHAFPIIFFGAIFGALFFCIGIDQAVREAMKKVDNSTTTTEVESR
jgi:hypothetical protein